MVFLVPPDGRLHALEFGRILLTRRMPVFFGGRITGIAEAWVCTLTSLEAKFSEGERHHPPLAKVAQLETRMTEWRKKAEPAFALN